ncbi:MAG: peroxiredoxin [Micromonosporaceae bacterium]
MTLPQPDPLPKGLPAPEDDGGARHLPGRRLPPLVLTGTDGADVQLDTASSGRWVLYLYPLTGEPGVDVPRGWDEIPGARGCSQEACSFRDSLAALQAAGAQRVLALSTDAAGYQQHLVRRLHLPFPMLSDPELLLARALDLPTFHAAGTELYKRLTMIVDGSRIEHVFYPIFPPDTHAGEVLDWLAANPSSTA